MRQRPRGQLTLPFVKASPDAQLRLLKLADLDTELSGSTTDGVPSRK